jgi:hypothetical protein
MGVPSRVPVQQTMLDLKTMYATLHHKIEKALAWDYWRGEETGSKAGILPPSP